MLVRFVAREGMVGVRREMRALLVWNHGSTKAGRSTIDGRAGLGRASAAAGRQGGNKPSTTTNAADEEQHGLLAGRADDDDDFDEFDSLDEAEDQREASISTSPGAASGAFELDDSDAGNPPAAKLSLRETAALSLEFCGLWFCANYFASACLEYTSVGSVTILTSTSSVWTLVFCAAMRVDTFTMRKLVGVLASLAGVVLISTVDLSGASDEDRGTFPHKSTASIAVGDGMAFFSAIVYGLYVTVMKRRVGDEERVDMPLFFGLVGLFNLVLLWPGFLLLNWTQFEPFSWPPTGKVWAIIVVSLTKPFFSPAATATAAAVSCHPFILILTHMRNITAQLHLLLHQRHVLGLRHAPHHPTRRHRRPLPHHPALSDWRNDSVRAVLELDLLGRRGYCATILFVHQS